MSHLDTRILLDLAEGVETGRYPEDLIRRFLERPWLVSPVYRSERKLWEIPGNITERVWTRNLADAAWLECHVPQPTVVRTTSGQDYVCASGGPRQLTLTPSGVPLFMAPRHERMPGEEWGVQDLYLGDTKYYPPVKGLETFACFADGSVVTVAQEGNEWVVAYKDQTRRFPNQYRATRWEHARHYDYTHTDREVPNPRPQLYTLGSQVFCWIPGDGLYACSMDPPRRIRKTAPVVTAPGYPERIGAYHRATGQVLWHDEGEEGMRRVGWFCNSEPVQLPCAEDDRLQGGFLHDGTRFFMARRQEGEWLSGRDSAEIHAGDRTISVQGPCLEYVRGLTPSQIILVLRDRQGLAFGVLGLDQAQVDRIWTGVPRFDRVENLQYAGDRGVAFIGIARKRSACYLMDWAGRLVQQGPQYRELRQLTVSPDGAHWAAIASNRDEHGAPQFVVVDGASGRLRPGIEQVVWCDSSTLRYLVNKAPQHCPAPQYCAYEVALGKDGGEE